MVLFLKKSDFSVQIGFFLRFPGSFQPQNGRSQPQNGGSGEESQLYAPKSAFYSLKNHSLLLQTQQFNFYFFFKQKIGGFFA